MLNVLVVSVFVFISAAPFALTEGKIFTKCELALELFRLGVPKAELPDWVCLSRYESNYNTKATNINKNKTKDWGIYQINDRYWCKPDEDRRSSNTCNISCNELLIDDITEATRCAQRIKKMQGFKAWYAWQSHCQTDKPNVDECF